MHEKPQRYIKLPAQIDVAPELEQPLIDYLTPFVTARRRQQIARVVAERTRYLTVVLENLSKGHNASAVTRSCDSFGVQDMHIIDTLQQYQLKRTAASGSQRWVQHHFYDELDGDNTGRCLRELREKGYRIVATTLRAGATPLHELSLDAPLALCFGTELYGLSDVLHTEADEWVTIPLRGFARSLNISVAAAICLSELTTRLRHEKVSWQLSTAEQSTLTLQWMVTTLDHGETLVRHFLEQA
jgi:tRNA (guanosine-2'-O-)-methyltransferase